jgi:hypothetical protein
MEIRMSEKENTPIDWNEKIDKENGILRFDQENGKGEAEFVKLEELLRIGRLRGFSKRLTKINQSPNEANGMVACAKARIVFKDGEVSDGAGDCGPHNAPGEPFGKYPTAIAESRAMARALRFGLGIKMCSVEEITFSDIKKTVAGGSPENDGKITQAQRAVIIKLIDRMKLDLKKVLALSKKEDLDTLTSESASKLIKGLNDGTIVELLNKK